MKRFNLRLLAAAFAMMGGLGAVSAAHAEKGLDGKDDRRAIQPISVVCFATPDGRANAKCTLTTVPAGKRLVTQSVSYFASSSSPVVRAALITGPSITNLPIAAPVSNPATGTIYITGLNLSMIVEEGVAVDFFMFGSNGNVEASLNGYLVDK